MELSKILDYAVMADETSKNPAVKSGYIVNGKSYDNYLHCDSFETFVADMKKNNPIAFDMFVKGGGKELEERKVGANTYPPKMASFGSSSRMIYNMMKDVDGFLFEKKLHTTVGGIANLDGFYETDDKYIFFEAKCREPYSHKVATVEKKYEKLYETITGVHRTSVQCSMTETDKNKIKTEFFSGNTRIEYFDMKQMICHLLGIATACLNGNYADKKIEFVYLLFNPCLVEINEGKEKIHKIYKKTCEECKSVDFKALLGVIIDYLQIVEFVGMTKNRDDILDRFTFRLCDQTYQIQ